jgi:hypothetical protein
MTSFPCFVTANDLDIYVEQVGAGPDVLLIGGLGDTVESWQFQLDARRPARLSDPEGPLSLLWSPEL